MAIAPTKSKLKKYKLPVETLRLKANYHRPAKGGKWIADFQGVVSFRMLFQKHVVTFLSQIALTRFFLHYSLSYR